MDYLDVKYKGPGKSRLAGKTVVVDPNGSRKDRIRPGGVVCVRHKNELSDPHEDAVLEEYLEVSSVCLGLGWQIKEEFGSTIDVDDIIGYGDNIYVFPTNKTVMVVTFV